MEHDDEVRMPHYLGITGRTTLPQRVLFFDTETRSHPVPGRPDKVAERFRLVVGRSHRRAGGKLTRTREIRTTNVWDFWEWVLAQLDPKQPLYGFAHNLGFDLTQLRFWELLDAGIFRLKDDPPSLGGAYPVPGGPKKPWKGLLVAEDPPTIIVVKHKLCTLRLTDTFNYWRCKLDKLGREIGVPKPPQPARTAPDAEWFDYCAGDVAVAEAAVTGLMEWWKREDLGPWRATAPGLAWSAFRRMMPPRTVVIHGHKDAIGLERDAYKGGEVRCFFVGTVHPKWDTLRTVRRRGRDHGPGHLVGPVHKLDVKSFYPSVMRDNLFPVRLVEWWQKGSVTALERLRAGRGAIAEVELNTGRETYPVTFKNRTRYARGKFTTVLAWPELQRALERDQVLSVGRVAVYQLEKIFTDYVDRFFSLRQSAGGAGQEELAGFYKGLLTSLSGKWGQRADRWQDCPGVAACCPWDQWFNGEDEEGRPLLWRAVGSLVQLRVTKGEGHDSFPAVAAFITSFGRVVMGDLRQLAGEGNVCYQDTDSLHVLDAGYRRLDDGGAVRESELGRLQLQQSADTAAYYGLKHYRFGDKVIVGSVARERVRDDGKEYTYLQFQRLPSLISSRPRSEIIVSTVTKSVSLNHPDGTAGPDGWVRPLTLPDDGYGEPVASPAPRTAVEV